MNPAGKLKILINESEAPIRVVSTMTDAVNATVNVLHPGESLGLLPQTGVETIRIQRHHRGDRVMAVQRALVSAGVAALAIAFVMLLLISIGAVE